MHALSRRDFLYLSLATCARLVREDDLQPADVHEQLLDLAARQEVERRARFAAVRSQSELRALQLELRQTFLRLLDGLPEPSGVPPVRQLGRIDADDYVVEKLVYESFPGYFVPALLYKPQQIKSPWPGIVSPCGHSTVGKASDEYQTLHINLTKRGYAVLTYDPVGQGERSQFWDEERGRSRFNLSCGEHAVLGNPLYLLGSSLARFRIWDGMRGIDYLASLPEVDARRIGCVGNSGGGTLSAYIAALDPRVAAAAICCYITTLPRRMGNRVQTDPSADPEQDIFGFVSEGIDHAGLLAMLAPRPVLLGTARFDFFPIEGARESFAEAKRLYEIAGAGERIERAEAAEKHGLTLPLRRAVYGWFERWLAGRDGPIELEEIPVTPRPVDELAVCAQGPVNVALRSRPLLPLALEEFSRKPKAAQSSLDELVRLDPERANFKVANLTPDSPAKPTLIVCINGNEARGWQEEEELLRLLAGQDCAVAAIDPRGVGRLRPLLSVPNHDYADPLSGVEENIAYNAFLVGKSLLGMRVTDILAAVRKLAAEMRPQRVVVCGRRDAALVACLAGALEPGITGVAAQEMLASFLPLFDAGGQPINAANILPAMLRNFGDVADLLDAIAPRRVLVASILGTLRRQPPGIELAERPFTSDPRVLIDWLRG